MDYFAILLIAGLAFLTAAFRTIHHPIAFKLAGLSLLACSFFVGQLITGSAWGGIAAASVWFFLPWIDLLTRVRRATLPTAADFIAQLPPNKEAFPELLDLTSEFEEAGFYSVEDAGWSNDLQRHFIRLFYHPEKHVEASVCLLEQDLVRIPYLTVTTRYASGLRRTSITYPFYLSLKNHPLQEINYLSHDTTPARLIEEHFAFIDREKVGAESDAEPAAVDPDSLPDLTREDINHQIEHNLRLGLLQRTEAGAIHYSWRGLFFLWLQYLRDLVRL